MLDMLTDSIMNMKVKLEPDFPHLLKHYTKMREMCQLKKYCLKVFVGSVKIHSFAKALQDTSTLKRRTLQ